MMRGRYARLEANAVGRAVTLYEAGSTVQQIAVVLECSYGAVHYHLSKANVTFRSRGGGRGVMAERMREAAEARAARNEERSAMRARAMALYETGLSIREVAAKLGCSFGTVRTILHKADVTLRPQGAVRGRSIVSATDATRLYGEGMGIRAVAAELGVKKDSVRKALLDAGVTLRRRGRVQARTEPKES